MSQDKGMILVIEDEPQMQRFLRIVLQGHGYGVIESQTGQEGLMQAATRLPDIIYLIWFLILTD
jgi:two-component system KDP operon response regulator KdpE